jgi:hypothetical protein
MTCLLFPMLVLLVFLLLLAKSTRSGGFEKSAVITGGVLEGAARQFYAARGCGMAE